MQSARGCQAWSQKRTKSKTVQQLYWMQEKLVQQSKRAALQEKWAPVVGAEAAAKWGGFGICIGIVRHTETDEEGRTWYTVRHGEVGTVWIGTILRCASIPLKKIGTHLLGFCRPRKRVFRCSIL